MLLQIAHRPRLPSSAAMSRILISHTAGIASFQRPASQRQPADQCSLVRAHPLQLPAPHSQRLQSGALIGTLAFIHLFHLAQRERERDTVGPLEISERKPNPLLRKTTSTSTASIQSPVFAPAISHAAAQLLLTTPSHLPYARRWCHPNPYRTPRVFLFPANSSSRLAQPPARSPPGNHSRPPSTLQVQAMGGRHLT